MYDLITDVHGHYKKLVEILTKLEYEEIKENVWKHPKGRKLIFLGDLVDRGPEQRKVVALVRRTCEEGEAECLMGNHEYNSVCWEISAPNQPNQFLYQRSSKNKKMHEAFLSEYEGDEEAYISDLKWFKSLPIAIEKDGFRAIHACWNNQYIAVAKQYLNEDMSIPEHAWQLTKNKDHPLHSAIENLIKGPEVKLPKNMAKIESDGSKRDTIRISWWPTKTENLSDILVTTKKHKESLLGVRLSSLKNRFIYTDKKPVFFGHYWFSGSPEVINEKMACLDYCGGKSGPLVAYRWDGEENLSSDKIITV